MGEKNPREKKEASVKFPPKPEVVGKPPMHEVGSITMVVGELLIVESKGQPSLVVDLDSWLCDHEARLIGFVMDVLGRVEQPFYAVRLEDVSEIKQYLGKSLYYIEGASKVLRDEDIQSLKSKSVLEAEEDDDSDDDSERIHRDFDEERHARPRTNKFREEMAPERRERTRDLERQSRRVNRSRSQHNQRYLDNMYAQHYTEMARLYGGQMPPPPQGSLFSQPQMHSPQVQGYPQMGPPQGIFGNQPLPPHNNIAQFGSQPPAPGSFFGQVPPPNLTGQGQPQMQPNRPYPWESNPHPSKQ